MNILSLIYSIPMDSHLTASTNHVSASIRPSSPEASASEVSDNTSHPASSTEGLRGDPQHLASQCATTNGSREIEDGVEAIDTAMFGVDYGYNSGHSPRQSISPTISSTPTLVASVAHPYGRDYSSTVPHRARDSSTLPKRSQLMSVPYEMSQQVDALLKELELILIPVAMGDFEIENPLK